MDPSGAPEPQLPLRFSWQGKKYDLTVPLDANIAELKALITELTDVPPDRQKLVGLVRGKLPSDLIVLESLGLTPNHAFMLMGTATVNAFIDLQAADLPEVIDDLELDEAPAPGQSTLEIAKNKRALEKMHAKMPPITLIHPLRPHKKLLVLDLDYTLFDCKTVVSHISQRMRPGMHEMLVALYPYYELVIWSQTSWRWLEAKITDLGMLTHANYKLAFVLDRTCMFSVVSHQKKHSMLVKHQVKSLELIWRRLPQFSAANTIHVDDLRQNFAMNPQSGLRISAFKHADKNQATDRALWPVTKYLLQLVNVADFTTLDHSRFETFDGPLPSGPPPSD
ncbi:hypothetical protein CXG81DRAFT_15756 [Caulochytrium protostelioides]|uniref:protein-serine/threonine phosphatase n=1 Tax=Caulochytrium protostelioides TaxID=1555241 RepID=A0A4P9X150_9FUNG|nr:hypothetical protein CXG81DRAFT_15756 [Caulochytrium protostelioides]|eukprot:RKO98563.1 hypothetical protein CXG81DRAFT_15756 [Caulochytrium protostelioides]